MIFASVPVVEAENEFKLLDKKVSNWSAPQTLGEALMFGGVFFVSKYSAYFKWKLAIKNEPLTYTFKANIIVLKTRWYSFEKEEHMWIK